MSDRPEDQDLVKFILDSGGLFRAVLRVVVRDRVKALANPSFWALLIHSVFFLGRMAIICLGFPLAIAYFFDLAFLSNTASASAQKGALTTLMVVAILVGFLAYMSWKDRPPK